MKLTAEELLAKAKTVIGDRTDDEALGLLEDVKDSFVVDTEDWKAKYEELDKTWREKYKARFFEGSKDEPKKSEKDDKGNGDDEINNTSLESLFEGGI